MSDRIKILRQLLTEDGILYIHIDDKEQAYLKIILDEIFGRDNFLNMIVVKTSDPSGHKTVNPSPYSQTEYIYMYAKDRRQYKYEIRYVPSTYDSGYNQYIVNRNAPYTEWKVEPLFDSFAKIKGYQNTREAKKSLGKLDFEEMVAEFALENAKSIFQPTAISDAAGRTIVDVREQSKNNTGRVFHIPRDGYEDVYVLNGRQIYFYENKIKEIDGQITPAKPLTNLWTDIPWNGIASEGSVSFKNGKKPERLLRRCIELATKPGDIVLDSFAGSGTTGSVAHKMGRRWIMVELGDHCHTHIIPRLQKVISGEDQGGISQTVEWKGGGGFRYYSLAPSLIEFDKYGQPVINKEYNPVMLTQAMCKLMGFTYAPSDAVYWQQGHSTETDYIYVTTQTLDQAQLAALSEEVGDSRSLLICCGAFRGNADQFENLTVRKIPRAVLDKCDWSKDDYSLNVQNLPMLEQDNEPRTAVKPAGRPRAAKAQKATAASSTGSLFGGNDADE